jgi:hypothetical protein
VAFLVGYWPRGSVIRVCVASYQLQVSVVLWMVTCMLCVTYRRSIGLQSSEGIGLIGYNSATLVTLGGCPLENRVYQYTIANTSAAAVCVNNADTGLLEAKLGPPSSSYMCAVGASVFMSLCCASSRRSGVGCAAELLDACPLLYMYVDTLCSAQAFVLPATGSYMFCFFPCLLLRLYVGTAKAPPKCRPHSCTSEDS